MIVAGVMSGTSADGINVAVVRVSSAETSRKKPISYPRFELLGHAEYPYPGQVRRAILASMNSDHASVGDLGRLNFLLGELYAKAVCTTQKRLACKVELVGCHGQTHRRAAHNLRAWLVPICVKVCCAE